MGSSFRTHVAFEPWQHEHQWDQTGPKCLTCIKMHPVTKLFQPSVCDGWELVERNKYNAKMRVQCHGAEQVVTFDMGTEAYTLEEVAKKFQQHRWFDPTLVSSVGDDR